MRRKSLQPQAVPTVRALPGAWTPIETAERLGISLNTLYKYVHLKKIRPMRVGRSLRFLPDDVSAWVAKLSEARRAVDEA
jgi:excisionase family DNA binding protein